MRIDVELCLVWQVQFFRDLRYQVFALQYAPICEQGEGCRRRVVDHPSPWKFFIFGFTRSLAESLELLPNVNMTSWVISMISVWLGFTQKRAVEQQLAMD
jgi:hypothetical protein